MGLGGPVWHASAAPILGVPSETEAVLAAEAGRALLRVGDGTRGEWHEWTGRAYHIRRRLSEREQAKVGAVIDIRGTREAKQRLSAVRQWLPRNWDEPAVCEVTA